MTKLFFIKTASLKTKTLLKEGLCFGLFPETFPKFFKQLFQSTSPKTALQMCS